MANSTFPTRIQQMIAAGWQRGDSAAELADRINNSVTAKKLKVKYNTQQIAASMAWHTIRANRG